MTTPSTGRPTPPAVVAEPRSQNAYAEFGTVYFWDETGSFSAEAERRHTRNARFTRRHR
jgi:hypothetical protein